MGYGDMKTTKKQFKEFCDEFKRQQVRLNLQDFSVVFLHKLLKDAYAHIDWDVEGAWATVIFTTEYVGDRGDASVLACDPVCHAKHEAMHLRLAKLSCMGRSRFVSQQEMEVEEEKICRVMESVL